MNRSKIFSTVINPPLVFGVTGSFAFLILFLLFFSVIFVRITLGNAVCFITTSAIGYFYYYGVKKTAKDPYWLNLFIMVCFYERKNFFQFIKRLITKKDKKLIRR